MNSEFIYNPDKLIEKNELNLTPEQEELLRIKQEEADRDIDAKGYGLQTQNVNLRITPSEMARAKRLAALKGLKYQTFLKMVIKEGMDKYENELKRQSG